MSFSRLFEYQWCPHRFFLSRVVRLQQADTHTLVMGSGACGSFMWFSSLLSVSSAVLTQRSDGSQRFTRQLLCVASIGAIFLTCRPRRRCRCAVLGFVGRVLCGTPHSKLSLLEVHGSLYVVQLALDEFDAEWKTAQPLFSHEEEYERLASEGHAMVEVCMHVDSPVSLRSCSQ